MAFINKKNINNVKIEKHDYSHGYANAAMQCIFLGTTETNLEEGSKWDPLVNGKTVKPNVGNIIISNGEAFVYTAEGWIKLEWPAKPISVPEDITARYSNMTIDTCSKF